MIDGFFDLVSSGEWGGCFEGCTGESNAVVGSTSIMSTSIEDMDILCIGAIARSGVCGSALNGGGGFVFMISRSGACSSPGLVVGEAGSGAGVCEDATSLEDAGDDCASCWSCEGDTERFFAFWSSFGDFVALLLCGPCAGVLSSVEASLSKFTAGGRGNGVGSVVSVSTRPFESCGTSGGFVEADRE